MCFFKTINRVIVAVNATENAISLTPRLTCCCDTDIWLTLGVIQPCICLHVGCNLMRHRLYSVTRTRRPKLTSGGDIRDNFATQTFTHKRNEPHVTLLPSRTAPKLVLVSVHVRVGRMKRRRCGLTSNYFDHLF